MSKKWVYEAIRTEDGVQAFVVVQNGSDVTIREPLPHIERHSPTGFEFGYGGSGPADLAYSILTHWFLSYGFTKAEAEEQASIHYYNFKWSFVAAEKSKRLVISDEEIENWWIEHEEAREKTLVATKGGE